MYISPHTFGLVIVGGGPAGLAPLLAAHRNGMLDALMDGGVAIVEQSPHLGRGSIGQYAINSDSSGLTFTDCLRGDGDTELTRLELHPLTRQLAAAGDGAVPLRAAGEFLGLVGDALDRTIAAHPACRTFTRHRAIAAKREPDGWRLQLHNLATGQHRTIVARAIVIATGAEQPADRLAEEMIGGSALLPLADGRLMQSGEVLSTGGLARVAQALAGKGAPRVAVLGGSTSAAAVAHALLHRMPAISFGAAGITLLHRRPLRIYYPDRAAALAEGYTEWTEDDVCPISGRVFRFAGFRLDSRELIMQARGIGGRAAEPRLRLHPITGNDQAARRLVVEADLVIAALGYRPRGLPIYDREGDPVTLLAQTGPQLPMVDAQCRVLDARGRPVEALFGIGLAAGFVPRGKLGGEASFRGQANGLWLWQHDVGGLIVDAVCPPATAPAEPARADLAPAGLELPNLALPNLALAGAGLQLAAQGD